jgi:hypothetical protein
MVDGDTTIFKRVFWVFRPSIQMLQYYRSLISIEDTFIWETQGKNLDWSCLHE